MSGVPPLNPQISPNKATPETKGVAKCKYGDTAGHDKGSRRYGYNDRATDISTATQ